MSDELLTIRSQQADLTGSVHPDPIAPCAASSLGPFSGFPISLCSILDSVSSSISIFRLLNYCISLNMSLQSSCEDLSLLYEQEQEISDPMDCSTDFEVNCGSEDANVGFCMFAPGTKTHDLISFSPSGVNFMEPQLPKLNVSLTATSYQNFSQAATSRSSSNESRHTTESRSTLSTCSTHYGTADPIVDHTEIHLVPVVADDPATSHILPSDWRWSNVLINHSTVPPVTQNIDFGSLQIIEKASKKKKPAKNTPKKKTPSTNSPVDAGSKASSAGNGRTRRRCNRCYILHRKCDLGTPCGKCIKAGVGNECCYIHSKSN